MRFDDPTAFFDQGGRYDEEVAAPIGAKQMKKIKLALGKSKPQDTAQFADGLVESLTGNAHVPAPDPALTVLTTGANVIREKIASIDAAKSALDVQRGELVTLNNSLKSSIRLLADHVEDKCDGNVDKLRSTGFSVVGDPVTYGELPAVDNLRLQTSDNEGQIMGRWKAVPRAASYVVDLAESSEGPWTQVTISTRVSFLFTGLVPGRKYWVRVRAVGTAGFGPWSDPACKMAA